MAMDEDYQDYIDDHEEYKKDMADEVRLQLTTGTLLTLFWSVFLNLFLTV